MIFGCVAVNSSLYCNHIQSFDCNKECILVYAKLYFLIGKMAHRLHYIKRSIKLN